MLEAIFSLLIALVLVSNGEPVAEHDAATVKVVSDAPSTTALNSPKPLCQLLAKRPAIRGILVRLYNATQRALAATSFSRIFLVLILLVAFLIMWRYYVTVRKYPPGPPPLPFIGNLHQIDIVYPYRSILKWQQEYGDVFTVWLPKPVIVVAEWNALQRLTLGPNGDHTLDRPKSYVFGIFTEHKPDGDGIILCSGPRWRAQRRFALSAFKSFGMGSSRMEERINQHKDELLRRLDTEIGQRAKDKTYVFRANDSFGSASAAAAVSDTLTFFGTSKNSGYDRSSVIVHNINEQMAFCFGNVIHDLVMGRYYAFNDPEFLMFKHLIDETLQRVSSVPMMIIDCYPWTRFFFPLYYSYLRDGYVIQKFFLEEIEQHAKRFDPGRQPTNFIDAYLLDMYNQDNHHLSKLTLALDSADLWTGGLETVVTTLMWAVLYLIRYPDVQARLQQELDTVLEGRAFQMSDRQRLPYLRATIDELQRIVNVLPWHIPHATNTELELCGRKIPKGATIMLQFGAVHFNERLFPEPEVFRPERFLKRENAGEALQDSQANVATSAKPRSDVYKYVPCEYLAPFGIGKRACLGEGLARMELHIVLVALVQNFEFKSAVDGEMPSLERVAGMTSKPRPFKCRVIRRKSTLVVSDSAT